MIKGNRNIPNYLVANINNYFISIYWDYALQVRLDEIVYVHCHQDSETGGTVILVGQDGVQRPPIHFPKGIIYLYYISIHLKFYEGKINSFQVDICCHF